MLTGSILPDVCVPTWLAIAGAILAVVALFSLLRRAVDWRRERDERKERRERERLSLPRWIELVALVVGTGIAVAGILHCGTPDVRISLADSRLNPAGYDDSSDEYVCLVNHDDQPVSLAGWEVGAAERRINVLPDFTLEPGAAVRVHPGEGTNSPRDLYGEKGSSQWRNTGGQISLFDSNGQEVDTVGYGERKDDDGSGECGSRVTKPTELALKITSPAHEAIVESATVTIRGTVTPRSVVRAALDHDSESELAGEVARVVRGDGVDRFAVDLELEPGENHVRVWAEKPGAEPAITGISVIWETTGGTTTSCDPNYEGACLDPEAEDYDCAGGEGDGPEYVEGPIRITGEDRFGLDGNEDGVACEP
jgi:hypothetical protein